jgi:superoxide dismutase, Cu-Zn family
MIKKMGKSNSKATCIMKSASNNETIGVIEFTNDGWGWVRFKGQLKSVDLNDGPHGFHVHQFGDMSRGCESMGPHFDDTLFPHTHGDINTHRSHWGDLGNVDAKDGIVDIDIRCKTISLSPISPKFVVGRGLVLHQNRDDLGMGGNEESLKTGNSGHRVACGVIAWSN